MLKGLPLSMTSNDVRRALKGISGVDRGQFLQFYLSKHAHRNSIVDLQYKHFRPTGRAIITMTLPDFTDSAVVACKRLPLRGYNIDAMPIADPASLESTAGMMSSGQSVNRYTEALGTGLSAGVIAGKTVTLSGFSGKTTIDAVRHLVSNFRLQKVKDIAPVQRVPLYVPELFAILCLTSHPSSPDKKFSMFARFCIHLESDSEAQRLVRQLHMRPYRGVQGGPIIRAEVIY
jgi:hypothetical protein